MKIESKYLYIFEEKDKNMVLKQIKEKCLTRKQVAEKLGISVNYFSDMLKGKMKMPEKYYIKLVRILEE